MEKVEEQFMINVVSEKTQIINSSTKSHNPGLRALLAIKNFNATLEKDFAQLMQIESDLGELNIKGLLMIEATDSSGRNIKVEEKFAGSE